MAISKMIHSVAVGDESVGKTSLLIALNKKPFKEFNPPITFEIYEDIFCKQEKYILRIMDTSDRVDSKLRQLTYSPARKNDVLLLCFSLNSKKSFEGITQRWTKDVKNYYKHSKIILIGTKSDLREPGNPDHVSDEEAKQLVFNQKFYCYIPCSSKTGENIDSIFPSIIKCFNNNSHHKKRSCGLNFFVFFTYPFCILFSAFLNISTHYLFFQMMG